VQACVVSKTSYKCNIIEIEWQILILFFIFRIKICTNLLYVYANCLWEIMYMLCIDHVSICMLRFVCHVQEIHKNNLDMHWMKPKNV
jgi:hypothetical protein